MPDWIGWLAAKELGRALDLSMVAGYLVLTLYIGIRSGRGVKTLKQFAISDRKFSTSFLVATIFATVIGAPVFWGETERTFKVGLVFAIAEISGVLSMFISGKFLAPRAVRFAGLLSVGDIMRKLYGKTGQVITGISAYLVSMSYVAGGVSAMGYISEYFLGFPSIIGILIGCGIVILYSCFGGMKSVVTTDLIQFVFIIALIPMMFTESLVYVLKQYSCGYPEAITILINNVPAKNWNIFSSPDNLLMYSTLSIAWLAASLDPSFTQRLLIVKNFEKLKKSLYITAIIFIPLYSFINLTAIFGHTIAPNNDGSTLFLEVVDKVMSPGFKGLIITGLLAAIMSSADSDLNASSVAAVNDVIKPFFNNISSKQEIILARLATVVIGLSAIFIAVRVKSIFDILIQAFSFWAPIVSPPLIAGFFYKEGSPKTFVISAFSGAFAVVAWNIFLKDTIAIDGLVIGIFANGLVFLLCRRCLDGLKWCQTIALRNEKGGYCV